MKIVFQDATRDGVEISVTGDLFMLPPGVRVTYRSHDACHLGPRLREGGGEPDVLVGNLDFLTVDRFGLIEYHSMALPAPKPFESSDVEVMWAEILEAALPNPFEQTGQGRLSIGGLSADGASLAQELLGQVQRACVGLLESWPQTLHRSHAWKPVDEPNGVEDELETMRVADRSEDVVDLDGRMVPALTARRVAATTDWRSMQLALAARQLSEAISGSDLRLGSSYWLTALLDRIAQRASPKVRTAAEPLSAWPRKARLAYSLIVAAGLCAKAESSGQYSAPLSDLWRIYESWVTVVTAAAIAQRRDVEDLPIERPKRMLWLAKWHPQTGGRVALAAQPVIQPEASTLEGLLYSALYSSTSELRPDLLLVVQPSSGARQQSLTVVDAKKRQGKGMTFSDAVEAGAKYMWSLRQRGGVDEVGIQGVILATPGPGFSLAGHHAAIDVVHLLPGSRSEYVDHVLGVIEDNLAGLAARLRFDQVTRLAHHPSAGQGPILG